ncbi:nuclear transport factor 2 family protein [Flavobacterium sp.]|uniref:nuclear transport factor 2 family protein n=1 Tax=Flavobacterium sp. TaxID=239 RepID=UPI002626B9E9|nr:nuclear transport factor 2 family protein [Flavobacterium sp.]
MKTWEERLVKLEDENEIRALSNKFADAANRIDVELFKSLWMANAEWTIGPPINQHFVGIDQISAAFSGLLASWEFFVQLPAGGNIQINGDTATAHFYVNEIARSKTGVSNYNLAQYEDQLRRENGVWRFVKRNYKVIYLDETPLLGTSFKL